MLTIENVYYKKKKNFFKQNNNNVGWSGIRVIAKDSKMEYTKKNEMLSEN